jgi:hypothetical protein
LTVIAPIPLTERQQERDARKTRFTDEQIAAILAEWPLVSMMKPAMLVDVGDPRVAWLCAVRDYRCAPIAPCQATRRGVRSEVKRQMHADVRPIDGSRADDWGFRGS